jgi:hypothetical protein
MSSVRSLLIQITFEAPEGPVKGDFEVGRELYDFHDVSVTFLYQFS